MTESKIKKKKTLVRVSYLQLWTLPAVGEPFHPMLTRSSTEQVDTPWGQLRWGPLCSTALLGLMNLSLKCNHGN